MPVSRVRKLTPGIKTRLRKLKNSSKVRLETFPNGVKFLESKNFPQAKLAILGIPLEATETFRGGVKKAPDEIRKASHSLESYSRFLNYDLKDLNFSDLGNLSLNGKLIEDLNLIEKKTSSFLKEKKKFVAIGGEHTISLGIMKGIEEILGQNFQVVIFDAHSDFRDNWEGEKVNHATVVRRLQEINDKLRVVGTRSFYGQEDYSQKIYVTLQEAKKWLRRELPVYLSLDMDVLDASFAPGVGNPEPDGLSYAQVAGFIHFLKDFSILGMDLVEVNPAFDPSGITSITAAKMIIEALIAMR